MIMPELEMRPIARRRMTDDELDLKRYAACELQGHPRCLLVEILRRRGDRRQSAETAEEHELEGFSPIAAAHA